MKKVLKSVSLILVPLIIVMIALASYDKYLDFQLENKGFKFDSISDIYALDEKDKGIELMNRCTKKDDLFIIGSSEMRVKVPQNPKNMFPNTNLNCKVNFVGRAYAQSLIDATRIAALEELLKNKKVVIIISLQWFIQPWVFLGNEIDVHGYASNFSELQYYRMLKNEHLSEDIKKYVSKRTFEICKNQSELAPSNLFLFSYGNGDVMSSLLLKTINPLYSLRQKFLKIKDKHQGLRLMKNLSAQTERKIRDINWEEEEVNAQKMGESECHNEFYIKDEYYNTYINEGLDKLKNSFDPDLDLFKSKEFGDYKVLLETCKELGIKPYVVFMSTNGFYYDYAGLNREKRVDFYDKLEKICDEYDFSYLDLREKEYEPYFYIDAMHLGWRGWLYVNKKITEHFSG